MTGREIPPVLALPDVVRSLRLHQSDDVVSTFEQIMRSNLTEVARIWDDNSVFVVTGDIPAMWLRDSAAQLRPYLLLCRDDQALQEVLIGVARRQLAFLLTDPYANSFTDGSPSWHADDLTDAGPATWERKFELDSLCFPVEFCYRLWKITGRTDFLGTTAHEAFTAAVEVFETEQDHESLSSYSFQRPHAPTTDTLVRNGKGRRTTPCGLVWSAFRPSDDAVELGYNIPGNMFVNVAAGYIAEMAEKVFSDTQLATRARELGRSVRQGIEDHGTVTLPGGKRVFAYETDGAGKHILMDDANMPSLLSAPLTYYVTTNDPVYAATREFVLSSSNPYFYAGMQAQGVGSPHTPRGYVWPIALAVQGLTAINEAERDAILKTLSSTTGGTGRMHESFDPDHPGDFTRPWFSWADAMFCELVLRYADITFSTTSATTPS
ncbi:glycoside hydrolase family 125 protein [Frigoribacterium faeni]|uniref:glycoside hydrolase family 125 protein n=1 Tax=Frigoribacterium faeni TaxID=145483 RepID=UPI0024134371|nr:glycoside hydrolase family 125 protein [Frigoribacterium faeni]